MIVRQEFERAGLKPLEVKRSEVELNNIPDDSTMRKISS
jgi:hypothetical protein